jgi:hypothetical protein
MPSRNYGTSAALSRPQLIFFRSEPRCQTIEKDEWILMDNLRVPDGPLQAGRDAAMRANTAAGRPVMETGASLEFWEAVCET